MNLTAHVFVCAALLVGCAGEQTTKVAASTNSKSALERPNHPTNISTSSEQTAPPVAADLSNLDKLVPTAPKLDDEGCPPNTRFLRADLFATNCASNQNPDVLVAVLRAEGDESSGVSIIVMAMTWNTAYGYKNGLVVSRKRCEKATAVCVETSYNDEGQPNYEATLHDGVGTHMVRFHTNGRKAAEGALRSEGPFGEWIYYDSKGAETHREQHSDSAALVPE